jgi:hypothetical protein
MTLLGTSGIMNNRNAITGNMLQISGSIISADVTSTVAGKFGHANGYPIVPAQQTNTIILFKSLILNYDFITAAYTAGGNITVNFSGGGIVISGLISAANSVGAATDKYAILYPLAATGLVVASAGVGLNLVTSAAFTQPGTAAGVIKYVVNFETYAINN